LNIYELWVRRILGVAVVVAQNKYFDVVAVVSEKIVVEYLFLSPGFLEELNLKSAD